MTEPPTKRAKRTDSSAIWERKHSRRDNDESPSHPPNGTANGQDRREDRDRHHERDKRRHRSRSRDRRRDRSGSRERMSKKKERSYSPEKDHRRHRDGGRDRARERRHEERSRSRDRHKSRRDDPPSRRPDRPRSRSASPRKDHPPTRTRTRTPPRSSRRTRSRSPPSKPASDRPRPGALPTGPRGHIKPPASSKFTLPPTNGTSDLPNGASVTPDPKVSADEMEVDSDPEIAMMRRAMGFTGFTSTKNTKVKGNNVSGIRKEKKTEYRQYMNRVGGFNRPLSPSR